MQEEEESYPLSVPFKEIYDDNLDHLHFSGPFTFFTSEQLFCFYIIINLTLQHHPSYIACLVWL